MRTRWLVTTMLLLFPAAAVGEQFDFGVRSQGGWTENVYGTSDDAETLSNGRNVDVDPVDDWSLRVSPWGKVSDPDGDVTWSLRYQPSYEYYLSETDINGFDHEVGGEVFWRVTDRTTLFAGEDYQQFRSLARFNEATGATESALFRTERQELKGNQTRVGLRQLLTPRDELLLNAAYNIRDYETSSDLDSWVVSGNWRHSLDQRTSLGLQGSWVRQSFSRQIGDDAVTDYYNVSATFDYQFSRTLRFEAYAGPAWIDADDEVINFSRKYGVQTFGGSFVALDADDCPLLNDTLPENTDETSPNYNPRIAQLGFAGCGISSSNLITRGEADLLGYPQDDPIVPGVANTQTVKLSQFGDPYELDEFGNPRPMDDSDIGGIELTYFARAAIIKDWERWHAQFLYERSSDDSGSFGTSSVRDSFELNVRWEPAQLWTVAFVGEYALLDQASDLVIPQLLIVENEAVPAGVDSVSQVATVQRLVVDVDDSALDYTSISASLTATRRITERSSVFGALYWYQQEQQRDLDDSISYIPGTSTNVDDTTSWSNITFWIGFDWQFDTIKF